MTAVALTCCRPRVKTSKGVGGWWSCQIENQMLATGVHYINCTGAAKLVLIRPSPVSLSCGSQRIVGFEGWEGLSGGITRVGRGSRNGI